MNQDNRQPSQGNPLIIVLAALCTLGLLSLMPWGELTGHRIKDFNLIGDILNGKPMEYITEEIIDPALIEALTNGQEADGSDDTPAVPLQDTVVEAPAMTEHYFAPRIDGRMVIEDYSEGHSAGPRILQAVASGTLRCAMIGDSYIEGDILSGTIRRKLQDRFGGEGVGYVPMTSAVAGFRRTVRISSTGFSACDIRHDRLDSLHTLPGEYFRAEAGANASFRGEKGGAHTASWSRSRVVFIAPSDGTISTSFDGSEWNEHAVSASSSVQCIQVDGATSRFDIRCDVPGLVVFGAWLDTPAGCSFDCMSLRGYSGISHRGMSITTARSIAEWVDYDMIVVEYGMNALSSEQTDYTPYGSIMKRMLLRLKACYPNAVVIMLGVGDRGQKQGSEVGSLPTTAAIVSAQRKAAKEAGVLFWDMREAMGGEGAVIDWRDRGLVNADYIHLNHRGGEEMGKMFVESLMLLIDE